MKILQARWPPKKPGFTIFGYKLSHLAALVRGFVTWGFGSSGPISGTRRQPERTKCRLRQAFLASQFWPHFVGTWEHGAAKTPFLPPPLPPWSPRPFRAPRKRRRRSRPRAADSESRHSDLESRKLLHLAALTRIPCPFKTFNSTFFYLKWLYNRYFSFVKPFHTLEMTISCHFLHSAPPKVCSIALFLSLLFCFFLFSLIVRPLLAERLVRSSKLPQILSNQLQKGQNGKNKDTVLSARLLRTFWS